MLGAALRRVLNRWFPTWEDAFYWASILENPSSWPSLASIPLFLSGTLRSLVRLPLPRQSPGTPDHGNSQAIDKYGARVLV